MSYVPKHLIDFLEKLGLRRPPDGGRLRDAAARSALHRAGFVPGRQDFILGELAHFGLLKLAPRKALQK
jgi:hypothetical protein